MAGWRDLPRPGARPPPSRRTVRFSVHTLNGKQLGRPGRPPLGSMRRGPPDTTWPGTRTPGPDPAAWPAGCETP